MCIYEYGVLYICNRPDQQNQHIICTSIRSITHKHNSCICTNEYGTHCANVLCLQAHIIHGKKNTVCVRTSMGSTLDQSRFFSALFPACQLASLARPQNRLQNWWIINSSLLQTQARPWLSDQLFSCCKKEPRNLELGAEEVQKVTCALWVSTLLSTLKRSFKIHFTIGLVPNVFAWDGKNRYFWCWEQCFGRRSVAQVPPLWKSCEKLIS